MKKYDSIKPKDTKLQYKYVRKHKKSKSYISYMKIFFKAVKNGLFSSDFIPGM